MSTNSSDKLNKLKASPKKQVLLAAVLLLLVTGCKPEKPLVPVPLTQVLSGKEKAPCEDLTFGGFPRSLVLDKATPEDGLSTSFVCRDFYVLNYDTKRNTSLWVVERLTVDNLSKPQAAAQLMDETRADPLLPQSGRATRDDYEGIGYIKGFFAPPQDFIFSDVGYSHSYYTSNLFPQHPGQKQVWTNLEEWVRRQVKIQKELVVVSGPVYLNGTGLGWVGVGTDRNGSAKSANKGKVQVPTHTFKVVVSPNNLQAIAFVVPNTTLSQTSLSSFVVSIPLLEQSSGLALFPDLPQSEAMRLKQTSLQYCGF